ncbi:MarR family winged helix-turn-helix transcriptional regulator [Actinacidiphila sp. DG2A-62]|uniref:MarR family winged helix-turn-helix transcriptional regulator n=1 Tax=Actinacidiphila sp. DG2A-62 TaxID=3108821 RepID=UPI002DB70321|nr:MarR family winged helix-turn-helix transcriptional regulator [Actinacidiphila sp. DG2A-62]MEC3998303.1 MarR family winged helix-turn-helix transcriptional regulator [Actinacidiphila sp. DG2A-62]
MDDATRAAPPPTLTGLTAYLLSRTGKAARGAVAADLGAEGLRLWHVAVLAALADFGPHVQRDLSARLSIDRSDMVKIVDDLTACGWAERTRDAGDRRRVTVTLTADGRAALAARRDRIAAVQDRLLAPLDAGERAQLHALLERVHTGIAAAAAPAGPVIASAGPADPPAGPAASSADPAAAVAGPADASRRGGASSGERGDRRAGTSPHPGERSPSRSPRARPSPP